MSGILFTILLLSAYTDARTVPQDSPVIYTPIGAIRGFHKVGHRHNYMMMNAGLGWHACHSLSRCSIWQTN